MLLHITSPQKRPRKPSASVKEPSADGKQQARSKQLKPHPDKGDMTLLGTQLSLLQNALISATPESVVMRNGQTLSGKLMCLAPATQPQKLLQKWEAASTLGVPQCSPYWDESCRVLSNA